MVKSVLIRCQVVDVTWTLLTEIALVGESDRPRIHADEVTKILRTPGFSVRSAAFLVGAGREEHGESMVASVIYRALLNSILERGLGKTYDHGVRYLRRLDELAEAIPAWRGGSRLSSPSSRSWASLAAELGTARWLGGPAPW